MRKLLLLAVAAMIFFAEGFSQTILQESFDGVTFAPTGWYNSRMAPSYSTSLHLWERVTSGTAPDVTPHSGTGMARFNSPLIPSYTETELGSMPINFSGGSRFRVRFWMFRSDLITAYDQLNIYVATSPSAAWGPKICSISVQTSKAPEETANGWYEYTFDVPSTFAYANSYLIFRAVGMHALPIYIDDVVVETITCHKPLLPVADATGTTTATINWNAPATGSPSGYEWEVRTAGSAGTGAAGLAASGTTLASEMSANVTGLNVGTNYKFYVRSICGTDKSTWTDVTLFKTQCASNTVPFFENFDGPLATTNTCTNIENINGGYTWIISSTGGSGLIAQSSPYAAFCQFGGTSDLPQNDWFYLSPLQLEAGKCYELYFSYRSLYTNYPTALEVKFGTAPKSGSMTSPAIFSNLSFTDANYKTGTGTFSVSQTGVYFIGFHHTGSDGGSVIIDDVGVKESIGIPVGISTTSITSSSVTFNWNAPSCGTASEYEWELRSSGDAGSGNTGLVNSGTGNVLTTTFNGLSEGSNYSFYIRAKSGSTVSAWSSALAFQTQCNIRTLPYSENFDGVTAPAKPSCILTDNPTGGNPWVNVANSWAHSAPNCMRIQYNSPSGNQLNNWFFTPPFNFVAGKSYRLTFWYRAHIVYSTEKLEVKYGQGASAVSMTSAPLFYNNALTTSFYQQHVVDFVPSANGNYNIGFHGFSGPGGNDYIRIDDITVSETPACDFVRNAKAVNITTSSATINWTAPLSGSPSGFNWELRTSGAAGSGSTGLVTSGTAAGAATSQALNGLTASTAYQFYIRSNCGAQNSDWVQVNFSAACNAVTIPYSENFDGTTAPAFPSCIIEEDKVDDAKWKTFNNSFYARSAPNSMWHDFNPWSPVDDWFYSAPLQLNGGQTYKISFYYNTFGTTYNEALEIKLGSFAQASSMTGTALYSASNLKANSYQLITVDFTAPSTGVFYLGFHSFSSYSQGGIYLDDLTVVENTTTATRDAAAPANDLLLNFFPNPTEGELMLKINRKYDAGKAVINIRDLQGRTVKTIDLKLNGSGNYLLQTTGLPGGMYLVEVLHSQSGRKQTVSIRKK